MTITPGIRIGTYEIIAMKRTMTVRITAAAGQLRSLTEVAHVCMLHGWDCAQIEPFHAPYVCGYTRFQLDRS